MEESNTGSRSRSPCHKDKHKSYSTSTSSDINSCVNLNVLTPRGRRMIQNKFVSSRGVSKNQIDSLRQLKWVPSVDPIKRKKKTSSVWNFMGKIIDATGNELQNDEDILFCKYCLEIEQQSDTGRLNKVYLL